MTVESTAVTSKKNLDAAITNASTAKSQLQDVIDRSGSVKTTLSEVISSANTAKTNLDASVSTANSVLQSLTAENASASSNIDELRSENFNSQEILSGVADLRAYLGLTADDIVGVQVDYKNKTFKRLAGAANLSKGVDFDKFSMFGGRNAAMLQMMVLLWHGTVMQIIKKMAQWVRLWSISLNSIIWFARLNMTRLTQVLVTT